MSPIVLSLALDPQVRTGLNIPLHTTIDVYVGVALDLDFWDRRMDGLQLVP